MIQLSGHLSFWHQGGKTCTVMARDGGGEGVEGSESKNPKLVVNPRRGSAWFFHNVLCGPLLFLCILWFPVLSMLRDPCYLCEGQRSNEQKRTRDHRIHGKNWAQPPLPLLERTRDHRLHRKNRAQPPFQFLKEPGMFCHIWKPWVKPFPLKSTVLFLECSFVVKMRLKIYF